MTSSYYARIKRAYNEGGLGGIFVRLVRKTMFLVWRRNEVWWYERDLTLPIPTLEPAVAAEVSMEAGQETWYWIANSLRNGTLGKTEREERRVGALNGHLFPLIKLDGKCVGYMKIGIGDVHVGDYGRILTFPPNSAVIYDSYIDPSLRGKKLAPVAIAAVMQTLRKREYEKMLCNIPEWNKASHNFVTKCGFVRKALIRFSSILGWKSLSEDPTVL